MTTPTLREAAQIAQAFIHWNEFGECRSAGWDGAPPTAAQAIKALTAALPVPDEPVAWHLTCINASNYVWAPAGGHFKKLQQIIACAYQIAGAYDAPEYVLDVLANPLGATQKQVDALLPFTAPMEPAIKAAHGIQGAKQ